MILSLDDCRQFSITMYLEISLFRRLHGHRNYKGYLEARSIAKFTCFLKETTVHNLSHIYSGVSRWFLYYALYYVEQKILYQVT